jgi:hypothetical protein
MLRLVTGCPEGSASTLAASRFWFHVISRYNHLAVGQTSTPIHQDNYEKTKTPAEAPFLTSDPKIILRRKPLPLRDLEKSEKNSLAKSRFI